MTTAPHAGLEVPPPPVPRLSAPWAIRPASATEDLPRIVRWMQAPHVAAFWKQAWPEAQWRAELERQLAGDHSLPCMLIHEETPLAYLEVYRVTRDRLAGHYAERPHDLGVHVAIGEPASTGRGLGRLLLREVARGLLAADPRCTRVVAEPDSRNAPSLRAFTAAGFRVVGPITLPDKAATLLVHPRSEEDLP
ncbi:acetyltransferase [Myxococcus sp. K15C18031901]|uniref:GNAT family N-acetyltransferase n=1 Tax=Myxococcus dinghuensis TaxID=2906761 RepID=UPI0020A7C4DC|nr:GNAT family N-acetyltransferase [Myxococcus dinghuensis]MCP3097912.1 acetyltransferase [Myxococcus dinghuensis]